jgi:leader peptidase (prepilin peptidase)/N-methyltransferase
VASEQALTLPTVAVALVVGAFIGGLLNIAIDSWLARTPVRLFRGKCPQCKSFRQWNERLPVLSWLLFRGRCRRCRHRIPAAYLFVEVVTAAVWAFSVYQYGTTLLAVKWALFGTILLGIAVADAREFIIPDELSVGGLVVGLLFSVHNLPPGIEGPMALSNAVLGAIGGFGLLWIVGFLGALVLKKDAMGGGDLKMMAMVGAFLGFMGVLFTIFLGALVGLMGVVLFGLFEGRSDSLNEQEANTEMPPGAPWWVYLVSVIGLMALLMGTAMLAMFPLNSRLLGLVGFVWPAALVIVGREQEPNIPSSVFVGYAMAAAVMGFAVATGNVLAGIVGIGVVYLLDGLDHTDEVEPEIVEQIADLEAGHIPFGVFLAVGAAVTYLYGEAMLSWYRTFLGI